MNQTAIAMCLVALALARCAAETASTESGLGDVPPAFAQPVEEPRLAAADEARQAGEYERALALLREILAENPTLTAAYLSIAEIYVEQEDYAKAEPVYARAARLDPRNFEAQFGHGLALQMLKRFVEAVKAYHRALTIQPDNIDANRHLATTYLQMRQPGSAIVFAEKAVEFDPASGPARATLAAAYDATGRTGAAIRQYEAALELMEPTPQLLMNLINVLAREKQYVDARNTAEYLVKLAPSVNAYERLGWVYFRLGDYEKSIEAYRSAVDIDPDHWPSLNGLGCNALNTWLLSGKMNIASLAEARQAFRQSLIVNADQRKVIDLLIRYDVR